MAELHVLRVFTDASGHHGNPLGVFLDSSVVADSDRQEIARELGFSETVFVDDRRTGRMRIYTPSMELGFAGHPTVGTAWLLWHAGTPVDTLRPPAGDVPVQRDAEGRVWITARSEWVQPPFELVEVAQPADVDALEQAQISGAHRCVWAWEDRAIGKLRSRVFPADVGIAEDEATGACAVQMAVALEREIDIRQGRGSRLLARPVGEGWATVGGTVVLDDRREFSL